jgi:farnesyl-diphosphate farnesyltransferase
MLRSALQFGCAILPLNRIVMPQPTREFLLGPLLKGVSRSFYLTLNILPAGMRDPIGLAYLLARAADTIADTSLIAPQQRLRLLLALRQWVAGTRVDAETLRRLETEVASHQTQSDEKALLQSLEPALAVLGQLSETDRSAVRGIVSTLSDGMEFDLRTFPDEQSGEIVALPDWAALDRYTYLVAGCVGEFWTAMTYAHLPGTLPLPPDTMMARGIAFGKALQMTNVLRDCGKDLRIGRCYLPADSMAAFGLTVQDLLSPENSRRARPLLLALVARSMPLFREGLAYLCAIPALSLRLRLACLWPIVIGLETLRLLVRNDAWLDPARVSKITRKQVYRIVGRSVFLAPSNRALRAWVEGLIDDIEREIDTNTARD